jgi:hypothetical protein
VDDDQIVLYLDKYLSYFDVGLICKIRRENIRTLYVLPSLAISEIPDVHQVVFASACQISAYELQLTELKQKG